MPTVYPSTSSPLDSPNNPPSSIEWNDDWADEPTLLQAIRHQGGLPSLVTLTIPVGSKTLKEFFILLSLCPNLRELTVKPREYDEIYECTLAPTDAWAWGALVPSLQYVTAPALLIGKLVPGRGVHTIGIIQEEREDSDVMLRHNLDALRGSALSKAAVENLVLEDIAVPFMRPLLMKVAETLPALKTLCLGTDAMDDTNDPDEKYQLGMIPDEIYEVNLTYTPTLRRSVNDCEFEPLFRTYSKTWHRESFAFLQH